MRLLPVLSVLVVAVASASASEYETRALATATTAPASAAGSSNSSAASDRAADIAKLREYYGDDVDKLSEKQLDQLIEKLHAETNDDPNALEALLEDSRDWFAKVGSTIKAVFVGKDDNDKDNDGGVFGKIWTSLFGKDSKAPTTSDGSGSGSMSLDVGHSGSMDTTIEETTTASSGSKEDTSIDTIASSPTPTPSKTTAAPKSSSRGKLLTSMPVAGAVAAVFVINFLQ